MATLAEIRARLAAAENKAQGKKQSSGSDNQVYPHWNMGEGTTASVRFLPDADPNNTFFWVERAMINLPFTGIKGDPTSKPLVIKVPCVEMYGENCPVLAEVRGWFKDPALEEMGRKYWKKRSYLFQGFVRNNPIGDDSTPENPIRRFVISPQIFNVIKASLMDPELIDLPTDYMNGLDFNFKKATKGGYADYSTSSWSRKESALTEAEQSAVDTYGLFDLKSFLPKKPSEAELRVIKEMFEASVDGKPYDAERWAAYYRPYGMDVPENAAPNESASAPAPAPVAAPAAQMVEEEDDVPFVPDTKPAAPAAAPAAAAGGDKAADILAMIRARQAKS